ncbi:ferrous iron transport protein A [Nostoc sp. C052]|uniref:FeoA family protein n=1 Tax=Nostoc sp. C052 TaxID=2576902 RepID=UPI0015C3D442|nr:FeoA family protein [Nostoc sp. C052]QLE39786.1 ferrous iron transport protein A [Nostoc sp. C052]
MFTHFSVTGCSLELLRKGERGIVTFSKNQDETILKKLMLMGLTPGANITLKQKLPSFIIEIRNTDMALNIESIHAIYVRIIDH